MIIANERQLVARARQGDATAFEALVTLHAQYVFNLALRVVRNPQDAEDIAQEAFLRAWRALPRFRGEAKFSTWLYRIVTNLCYNRLPSLKTELAALEIDEAVTDIPDRHQGVEDRLLSAELQRELHQAIADLPESYQMLITLRHLQGMSYQEIARVMDIPLGTVKTGIFRARKTLKSIIEAHAPEPVHA